MLKKAKYRRSLLQSNCLFPFLGFHFHFRLTDTRDPPARPHRFSAHAVGARRRLTPPTRVVRAPVPWTPSLHSSTRPHLSVTPGPWTQSTERHHPFFPAGSRPRGARALPAPRVDDAGRSRRRARSSSTPLHLDVFQAVSTPSTPPHSLTRPLSLAYSSRSELHGPPLPKLGAELTPAAPPLPAPPDHRHHLRLRPPRPTS